MTKETIKEGAAPAAIPTDPEMQALEVELKKVKIKYEIAQVKANLGALKQALLKEKQPTNKPGKEEF